MPRQVPGDPLTGSLPRTQLVVPQGNYGPTRTRRPSQRDTWPIVPDSLVVTMEQLRPGRVAYVRTRRGVRRLFIRTINVSHERRNKGRHYLTGVTRRGLCHSYWVDRVISVQTVQAALAAGKALLAIEAPKERP